MKTFYLIVCMVMSFSVTLMAQNTESLMLGDISSA